MAANLGKTEIFVKEGNGKKTSITELVTHLKTHFFEFTPDSWKMKFPTFRGKLERRLKVVSGRQPTEIANKLLYLSKQTAVNHLHWSLMVPYVLIFLTFKKTNQLSTVFLFTNFSIYFHPSPSPIPWSNDIDKKLLHSFVKKRLEMMFPAQ